MQAQESYFQSRPFIEHVNIQIENAYDHQQMMHMMPSETFSDSNFVCPTSSQWSNGYLPSNTEIYGTSLVCVFILIKSIFSIWNHFVFPTQQCMLWMLLYFRYRGHPQTPSISPVQSITTVIPPLSPTLHLPRATAPQHGWIWALVSLQKATTISTATSSIAFACRTAPMCRKAWPLQSMRPTALQTVCFHTTATTVISGGIP